MRNGKSTAGHRDQDAWWAASRLEPEVRLAVTRELELELARRSISGAMVYFAMTIVLAIATPYYADHRLILAGVSVLTLLFGGLRIAAARRLLHSTGEVPAGARRLLHASIYLSCAIWGLFCGATLQFYGRQWTTMFLLLVTASLASGGAASFSPSLPLATRGLLLLVTPTVLSALALGEVEHIAIAAGAAIYLGFLLAQARGNQRAFWTANVAAEREKIRGSADRMRAEMERATLAAAIEQAADEIIITDAAGNLKYCNPAFERITGYTRAEVMGRNPRFLKSGKQPPEFYAELWSTLTRGQVWNGQFTNRRKDGTLYEANGAISPIYDAAGQLAGFVSVRQDVTERLRLEAELRQAQKLESVGRLAGGVAHDFNNLLTIIIGYGRMLLEQETGELGRLRPYIEEICGAGERAASLTRQLLSFSRKQILVPRPVALDALAAEMKPMLERMVGEDVTVEVTAARALGLVRADSDQIGQILMNLAANARDAMPNGGRLTIRMDDVLAGEIPPGAPPELRRRPAVLLAVSDSGTGMDEETRQHAFEPFFTTKDQGRGTGLGLATVYGIVQQSEGWLELQTEPGQGTTFRIYLPRIEGNARAPEPDPPAPTRGNETVLLVEDQPELRKLATTMLRSLGYDVLDAPGGHAALRLAAAYPDRIDLLLTDVIMPDITGVQVSQELARSRPDLKVLYMSGYPGQVLAHRGILDSSVGYLPKPFTSGELAAKLREVLGPVRKGRGIT